MKPKVYITRHLPEVAWYELHDHVDAEGWNHETPPAYETLLERVQDKEGLICLLTDRIDADLMDAAPRLKVISQVAVGYDNIDVQAATERGIKVGNTPGVLTDATADFTFALLMAAARRIGEAIEYVHEGRWQTWGLTTLLGQDVHRATLGIIGFGRIGQALARRAQGFNMRTLYHDNKRVPEAESQYGAEYRSFEELLAEADFVSLHVPLNESTHYLIDAPALVHMKPTATLINTSRGAVIDPEALYEALRTGAIAAAALDVTEPEPLPADHKLLRLPNLIVTPHIASATVTSRNQMAQMAVRNLLAGLRDEQLPFSVN